MPNLDGILRAISDSNSRLPHRERPAEKSLNGVYLINSRGADHSPVLLPGRVAVRQHSTAPPERRWMLPQPGEQYYPSSEVPASNALVNGRWASRHVLEPHTTRSTRVHQPGSNLPTHDHWTTRPGANPVAKMRCCATAKCRTGFSTLRPKHTDPRCC